MAAPHFIHFRRAGTLRQGASVSKKSCAGDLKPRGELGNSLSGSEARAFYEEILSSPTTSASVTPSATVGHCRSPATSAVRQKTGKRKQRPESPPLSDLCGLSGLFRAAQDGDFRMVRKAVDGEGCDVNATDNFAWTPLMCSCHAGHENIAHFLLERGAVWYGVTDKKGRDARQLAVLSEHWDIVECLDSHGEQNAAAQESTADEECPTESYCGDCKTTVVGTKSDHREHFCSTAHLFAAHHSREHPAPFYGLPTSNRGYQMLVRDGWNAKSGLGPKGEGRRYPIKTALKRDRAGVGSKRVKEKVTHFQPHDAHAISSKISANSRPLEVQLTKRQLRRRQEQRREKEKQLRRELGDAWM